MSRPMFAFDLAAPGIGVWSAGLAALEAAAPLRARTMGRPRRWRANLILAALAAGVVRAAILPAMLAVARRRRGRGLLAPLPPWLRVPVGMVLLDASIWAWHRANHVVPALWRFHAQHHTDPDLDVTTAFRFHVGELVLSIPARCVPIALLGVGPGTVVGYEVLLQLATAFHHANLRLPSAVDRALTTVLVTPRMHGIHHSRRPEELDASWGVVLTVWDRLAGTLRLDVPQDAIAIGIPEQPSSRDATDPRRILAAPLTSRSSGRRCGRPDRAPA